MSRAAILREAEAELWKAVAYYEQHCPGFPRSRTTSASVSL